VEEAKNPTREVKSNRDIQRDIPVDTANAQIAIIAGKSNLKKTSNIQQINLAAFSAI
jgi:hypothetical protein